MIVPPTCTRLVASPTPTRPGAHHHKTAKTAEALGVKDWTVGLASKKTILATAGLALGMVRPGLRHTLAWALQQEIQRDALVVFATNTIAEMRQLKRTPCAKTMVVHFFCSLFSLSTVFFLPSAAWEVDALSVMRISSDRHYCRRPEAARMSLIYYLVAAGGTVVARVPSTIGKAARVTM